jgi:hypothetical protein
MRALHRPEPRRVPMVWRMAAAFAMVFCIVAVAQIAILHQQQRARMETLRAEQQRIQAELAAVKKIADDAEPVVVLEDNQGTRVIMDLDSAVQPVSLRTYD